MGNEKSLVVNKNAPLLSICIPTYKRPEIIDMLLESIVSQEVDKDLYEICITDNSTTDETADLIHAKYSDVVNLRYKKTTCEGFLNSVEALHFGNGAYIKLHNDYSIFNPGSIQKMIDRIKETDSEDSYIYFSFGSVKDASDINSFNSYDEFMRFIKYGGHKSDHRSTVGGLVAGIILTFLSYGLTTIIKRKHSKIPF